MSTFSNGTEAARQASPSPRPRPNSRHLVKRSLTELASPSRLHRRPHLQHPRQECQYEVKDKPPSSSAILAAQIRTSLDIPMSAGTSPFMTPSGSRRASDLPPKESGHDESKERKEARSLPEQQKAFLRADGLKQSLAELNSLSTSMTKRLDDTYYGVLERMSTLQNTVIALRDLAQNSHAICEAFDRDSRDLESDIIRQLSSVGHFEEQQRKISNLRKRIYESRERISELSSRVDAVQQCVERWERADKRWQEKTRKRLKIIWFMTTIFALLIILFAIGMSYADRGGKAERATDWNMTSPNISLWPSSRRNESIGEDSGEYSLWKSPLTEAEQLRGFDEL